MTASIQAIARAVIGDTAPLERALAFLDRFDAAKRAGIPERALLVMLHAKEPHGVAWQTVGQWLTGGGLYVMSGPVGTGKTVAAARWAAARSAQWIQAGRASESWDDWQRTHDRAIAAPALVVDELGGPGSVSDLAAQRLSSLLCDRHGLRLPSLGTSNLSRPALAKLLDGDASRSRTFDRVDEDGGYAEVTERLRETNTPVPWERVEQANRLVLAWRRVERVANGDGGDDAREQVEKLRRALKFSDADLAAALAQQERLRDAIDSAMKRYDPPTRVHVGDHRWEP